MVITDTNLSLAGHHQLMQSGEFYFFYLTLNYVTPAFDFFFFVVCLFLFVCFHYTGAGAQDGKTAFRTVFVSTTAEDQSYVRDFCPQRSTAITDSQKVV